MIFRHEYNISSDEIKPKIRIFKFKYGHKPDYMVLNSKTLFNICGELSKLYIPNKIESLRYEIDDDIKEDLIMLCEI